MTNNIASKASLSEDAVGEKKTPQTGVGLDCVLVGAKIDFCLSKARDLVLTCAEVSWFYGLRSTHGYERSKQWKLSPTVVAAFTGTGGKRKRSW